ncbi:hypothetical protein B0H14DRAFT_2566261 [Mycena olivaceomarginata]|nr:hypothetical protein B0H14DRAFT_2566261 [Mycena olivaceomarginata]
MPVEAAQEERRTSEANISETCYAISINCLNNRSLMKHFSTHPAFSFSWMLAVGVAGLEGDIGEQPEGGTVGWRTVISRLQMWKQDLSHRDTGTSVFRVGPGLKARGLGRAWVGLGRGEPQAQGLAIHFEGRIQAQETKVLPFESKTGQPWVHELFMQIHNLCMINIWSLLDRPGNGREWSL